ncbi:MAG: hypothetical protein ACTSVZ_03115 [Promethearchaeota archaeon]
MSEENLSQKKRDEEKSPKTNKNASAKEVAETMAANMQANMRDPNFLEERELLMDRVRKKVIAKRKERETRKDGTEKEEKRKESNNTEPPKST